MSTFLSDKKRNQRSQVGDRKMTKHRWHLPHHPHTHPWVRFRKTRVTTNKKVSFALLREKRCRELTVGPLFPPPQIHATIFRENNQQKKTPKKFVANTSIPDPSFESIEDTDDVFEKPSALPCGADDAAGEPKWGKSRRIRASNKMMKEQGEGRVDGGSMR